MLNNCEALIDLYLKNHLKPRKICLDMTCGNGKDSIKLLQDYSPKFLYAFDIQEEARGHTFNNLKKTIGDEIKNFRFILDNHANFDLYVEEKIDLVIYNLGYLPGGDKAIVTKPKDLIASLEELVPRLNKNALVFITCYPGHESGRLEAKVLLEFLKEIDQKSANIIKHDFVNQKNSPPYLIVIEKR